MTPIEAILEARRLGIRLWLGGEPDFRVMAEGGAPEVRAWLRTIRDADPLAFGLAVALVSAVERSGGDPERLRHVAELQIVGVQ